MKVFLSAYACEPGKGSEPGVGWRWARGLAERVELHVLTRESNRRVIEKTLGFESENSPLKKITFHYYDLSKPFLWAKRHGLPTAVYYLMWQWAVSRRFGRIADESDVVHHLTFCNLLCPGFWKLKSAAFVLGPVGAPQVNSHYFPLFGGKAWLQKLRAAIMNHFLVLPWVRRLLISAEAVVPANSETRDFLIAHGIPAKVVILDTGAPTAQEPKLKNEQLGVFRLMYAGQLEQRKGLELALRALALTIGNTSCRVVFDIFGQGPSYNYLIRLTEELSIVKNVKFHGAVPHAELLKNFQLADAFIFTSVRDTSGGVNLEAMAHGLPVICIAHQGVGDITDDSCAERILPGPINETVKQLAVAIVRLANDSTRRQQMGIAAAKRALEFFSWEEKFEKMCLHYEQAVEAHSLRQREL